MKSEKSDFTQGSILKKLALFMLPILGALVLQAAYGAVDLLVVGHFGSTSGLSAVSTGSQILNLVTFVVTQFAMGITVLIARYLGEKRPQYIGQVIGGAVVVFALISAALFVVMVGFARPISVLMQAPAEAVDLTASYVRICGGGIFFIVAYNLLSAIFRGLGDSKSPLLFVLMACIVNVFGDLALVAGLHMDAAGAAIATVAAQAVSVVCAVIMLLKKKLPFRLQKSDFRLNLQCRKFLGIGLPLALQEFLTQLSFLALCAFVNRLGLEASSGYGVACKIVNFAMLIPSALMQSMAAFVSQNIGAGNPKRAVWRIMLSRQSTVVPNTSKISAFAPCARSASMAAFVSSAQRESKLAILIYPICPSSMSYVATGVWMLRRSTAAEKRSSPRRMVSVTKVPSSPRTFARVPVMPRSSVFSPSTSVMISPVRSPA